MRQIIVHLHYAAPAQLNARKTHTHKKTPIINLMSVLIVMCKPEQEVYQASSFCWSFNQCSSQ